VGPPQLDPYAKILLSEEQVGLLAGFLEEGLSPEGDAERGLQLTDEDEAAFELGWDHRGRLLDVVGAPARNRGGIVMTPEERMDYPEATRAQLGPEQVEKLAAFVLKRPAA
jgi:hypothetical protein